MANMLQKPQWLLFTNLICLMPIQKSAFSKFHNYGIAAGGVALLMVIIFAPRMEGPRGIRGIEFTTKMGTPGSTNVGWAMLIFAPILAYGIMRLLGGWIQKRQYSKGKGS